MIRCLIPFIAIPYWLGSLRVGLYNIEKWRLIFRVLQKNRKYYDCVIYIAAHGLNSAVLFECEENERKTDEDIQVERLKVITTS